MTEELSSVQKSYGGDGNTFVESDGADFNVINKFYTSRTDKDDNLIGLVSEHAPVQAVYVGCVVDGSLAKAVKGSPTAEDYENYIVRPGQVLYTVKDDLYSDRPRVIANLKNYDGKQELWPFGVAHDSVLDGKLAYSNPHSVAGISAIVSGCVTVQMRSVNYKHEFVGRTLYSMLKHDGGDVDKRTADRDDNTLYHNMADYRQGKFLTWNANTSVKNKSAVRFGHIVEVYPEEYGVVRVCLDIQGYRISSEPGAHKECNPHPTVAPQQPVYIAMAAAAQTLWREGLMVHNNVVTNRSYHSTDASDDNAMLIAQAFPAGSVFLPECIGVTADTNPVKLDRISHFPASVAIAGCVSLSFCELVPVGAWLKFDKTKTGRVINRLDNGEHLILLNGTARHEIDTESVQTALLSGANFNEEEFVSAPNTPERRASTSGEGEVVATAAPAQTPRSIYSTGGRAAGIFLVGAFGVAVAVHHGYLTPDTLVEYLPMFRGTLADFGTKVKRRKQSKKAKPAVNPTNAKPPVKSTEATMAPPTPSVGVKLSAAPRGKPKFKKPRKN